MKLLDEYELHRPSCKQCGRQMSYGRPDRKFCSRSCKNKYHNNHHIGPRLIKVRIQHILEKNYRILNSFMEAGISAVPMPSLLALGFNTMYSTGIIHSGRVQTYMCFDIQYRLTATRIFQMELVTELM